MTRVRQLSSRCEMTVVLAPITRATALMPNAPSRLGMPLRMLFGLMVLIMACVSAKAQFNGPPLPINLTDVSKPAVLTTDPAILYPPIKNTTLRAGDTITVKVYGDDSYAMTGRIDNDGTIKLPAIGIVHLAGLNIEQAEAFVGEKLVDAGMFLDPQMQITSIDGPGQFITVIGESKGLVPAIGNRKLLEVLSVAGGIGPSTSHVIAINREGLADPIVIDLGSDPLRSEASNIPVFAGDIIVTSRIGLVYVLGGFKTIGTIPLTGYGPLSMTELTSLAGGTTNVAKLNDLRIIRTVGNRRTVATYDIKKILNGQAPDPILQPNDIVYMPNSALKSFFFGGTLNTFLSFLSIGLSLEALR